jgi:hypothetical protein
MLPRLPPRKSWHREPVIAAWRASGLDLWVLLFFALTIERILGKHKNDVIGIREKTRELMHNLADFLLLVGRLIFVAASLLNLL